MASIEFLHKRIAGKEKELDKLNKKLARIRKVEAQGWKDPNPYYYHERDLKSTLRDIEVAQAALNSYKEQLTAETEKANSRNVPAIIEFLDNWKQNVFDAYKNKLIEFFEEKQNLRYLYDCLEIKYYSRPATEPDQIAYEEAREAFYNKCNGFYEEKEVKNLRGILEKVKVKVKDGEYEWLNPYNFVSSLEEALAKVDRDLQLEWNRKYDFIIERTNQIVGQITDASNLRVGEKGDLNGYIIGAKGIANVQTISAGGHNIQRFHFRTLINKA